MKIAQKLNVKGIKPKKGGKWNPGVLRNIWRNDLWKKKNYKREAIPLPQDTESGEDWYDKRYKKEDHSIYSAKRKSKD